MALKKIIYAHGIHSGGGLLLLREIFAAVEGDAAYQFILDARCHQYASQYNLINVDYFSPGLMGRLLSELQLKGSSSKIKSVLSSNSLPFLIDIKIHTTIFFQNVNLITTPARSGLAQRIKHRLFKRIAANVDQFVVQTRSVHDSVSRTTGRPCRISTLSDPFLLEYLNQSNTHTKLSVLSRRFVYVADGTSHKNHTKLLQAWKLLHEVFPNLNIELLITLPFNFDGVWEGLSKNFDVQKLSIINQGVVSREKIFEVYKGCDALIFPSLGESFGLPLLEAAALNLDILAYELDFVRDVVSPIEVFNPNSHVSIARSVARYLDLPWPASTSPVSAKKLLNEVFDE